MTTDKEPTKQEMISEWGTKEQYYKELEGFYKQHKQGGANLVSLVMDPELNCPIKAGYYFRPRLCYLEGKVLHLKMQQAIAEPEKS